MNINFQTKEIHIKVVYYGPGLSGKTTNLEVIHKVVPERARGQLTSVATEQDRTLFFDYMPLDLGKLNNMTVKLRLFTVPGQVYYNSTRRLVLRGTDGVVFVADSQRDKAEENLESLQNLKENLSYHGLDFYGIALVLQYNKRDLPDVMSKDELDGLLNSELNAPSMVAVAVKNKGVISCLKKVGELAVQHAEKKLCPKKTGRHKSSNAPMGSTARIRKQAALKNDAQAQGTSRHPTRRNPRQSRAVSSAGTAKTRRPGDRIDKQTPPLASFKLGVTRNAASPIKSLRRDAEVGKLAVAKNLITPKQLAQYRKEHQDMQKRGEVTTFPQLLIHRGILSMGQMSELLRESPVGQPQKEKERNIAHKNLLDIAQGDILAEKYKIVGKIGTGGMGTVFKVEHNILKNRYFALKVMNPSLGDSENVTIRFVREVEAVMELFHKNIIPIRDCGLLWKNIPYFVMDYSSGIPLQKILEEERKLDWKRSFEIVGQILSALAQAHSKGIVHRDIKPDNILVEKENGKDIARIVDFGLAKLTELDTSLSITQGGIIGTPLYMSPEQAGGESVDSRSDLYSVGIILYRMVAGKLPFIASNMRKLLTKQLFEPPPPFAGKDPAIPEFVESIIFKALHKSPKDRYSNAEDFEKSLEQALSSASPQIRESKIKVLVIDDSMIIRKIFKKMLSQDRQFELEEFKSLRKAIESINEIKPDLVLLDVLLPDMSSLEAIPYLRYRADLPIVMLTTYSQEGMEITVNCLLRGATDFIGKPDNAQGMKALENRYAPLICEQLKQAHNSSCPLFPNLNLQNRQEHPPESVPTRKVIFVAGGAGCYPCLFEILNNLRDLGEWAIVVTLYNISNHFLPMLVSRLKEYCSLPLTYTTEAAIKSNHVYFAPAPACVVQFKETAGNLVFTLEPNVDMLKDLHNTHTLAQNVLVNAPMLGKDIKLILLPGLGQEILSILEPFSQKGERVYHLTRNAEDLKNYPAIIPTNREKLLQIFREIK